MKLPPKLEHFLLENQLKYDILPHPSTTSAEESARSAYIPTSKIIRTTILRDSKGILAALYPATYELDIESINRQLQRQLEPLDAIKCAPLFPDCAKDIIPAITQPYGIKSMVDESLQVDEDFYFEPGTHTELIRINALELQNAQNAWHGTQMAKPKLNDQNMPDSLPQDGHWIDIKHRIQQLTDLPAMPTMAQRILQLRSNPYACGQDLVEIVELDPSLTAQVIRYARSPFFGCRDSINTLADAIIRVLGYDMTLNIVLGIAFGRSFNNPTKGPLGLDSFWRHSIHCASLTHCLAQALPQSMRPKPGLPYLAGMLHNFGILLLGHLFQPEMYWLNKLITKSPEQSQLEIETQLLGSTHSEIGSWLMEHWNLPAEVITTVREHHNAEYSGIHALYPRLVLIANHLLKRNGIGDAPSTELPESILDNLHISEQQALQAMESVLEGSETLDGIASKMAA